MSVKATEHEVSIYSPEIELLSRHERLPAGLGKKQEDPAHARTQKVRYGLEPVREAFMALGEAADIFLKGLTEKHPGNCGFHARYILRLKEIWQSDDIHDALIHALHYQVFEGRAIERILRAKANPRTLESVRNEHARRELEKVLPKITQRPLTEYGAMVGKQEKKDEDKTGGNPDEHQDAPKDPETGGDPESF